MGWKELLKNIRLVDLQINIKKLFTSQQTGIVNVAIYNMNMPPDMMEKIVDLRITAALEKSAKDKAFRELEPLSSALNLVAEATTVSMVASTLATAALSIVAPIPEIAIVSDKHTVKIVDDD